MAVNQYNIEVIPPSNLTKTYANVKCIAGKKYLSREDIVNILDRMPAGKNKMICITLWMTGLRVSELISLRTKDIDFEKRLMTIRWLKNRQWKQRIIPAKTELLSMLQFYTTQLYAEDKIFPFSRQRIYQITKKYFKTNPHTFRHSFAINFLNQTKNAKAIVILKQYLGHSRIKTTMEYLKIVPFDMANELDKVKFN